MENKTSLSGHNGTFTGRDDDVTFRDCEGDLSDIKHTHARYVESNVTSNSVYNNSKGVWAHAISPFRNERVKVTT